MRLARRVTPTNTDSHGQPRDQCREQQTMPQNNHALQDEQPPTSMWTQYTGTAALPTAQKRATDYRNEMCPAGIATSHPAGDLLAKWAQLGCPTKKGHKWSKEEMWKAVARAPHQSSLSPEALSHFCQRKCGKGQGGAGEAGLLGRHQEQPTAPTQNFTDSRNPTQIKSFLIQT